MNRREALSTLAAGLASAAIPGAVEAIDKEPEPLCLIVRLDHDPSQYERACIRKAFDEAWKGPPPCPIFICKPGMTIEAALHPERN